MTLKSRLRMIYDKLTCPVVSACIIISISYFFFLSILPSLPSISQIYYNDVNSSKVEIATKNVRNLCGEKYFTVWLSLQMNKSKDKFLFKEIKGCNKANKKDCSYDVKVFNPYYSKAQFLDECTRNFINEFSGDDVFYTKDLDQLKRCGSIKMMLDNTNRKLTGLGLKIVRDIQRNIIYVFAITHLEDATACDRKQIVSSLDQLSDIAREGL